mmetsp:Transcript_8943/g.13438  ORF Transcript_8943/g.13438 Transcript_8943/m.13438 type:complete len:486 (+) Transcript_8943:92-1549(+)
MDTSLAILSDEAMPLIPDDDGYTLVGNDVLDQCIDKTTKSTVHVVSLAMGNAADAVEIICVGYIMSEMNGITTRDKELLSAAVFIGMLLGGLLCGILSDRIGRKPCLQYSLFLNALAGLASAAAPNITWLIIFRVVGGIGIGGSVPSVFTLGAEVFPSSIRGRMLSVIASFWMVGAIYTGLTGWLMLGKDFSGHRIMPGLSWRWFAAICSLPAIIALILTTFVLPESPRYLVGKGKFKEAAAVLSDMSGMAVYPHNLEQADRYSQSHSVDKRANSSSSSVSITSIQELTILHLFRPELIRTTVNIMLIWFTLSFGSYGLSTWITVLFEDIGMGNVYASAFIFALANLPGNLVSIVYMDRIGRRRLLTGGMVLAAFSAVGFAEGASHPPVVILCATLFNAFSVAGWNALDCLSVENFPTEVRTTAMGVLAASGRVGAVCAQFVNGTLEKNVPLLLFVTSGCMFVGGVAARFTARDETGRALTDHTL